MHKFTRAASAPQRLPKILGALVGTVCAAAAVYMIAEDAIKTGNWSMDDKLLPVIILITIAAGHLIVPAARERKVLAAVGWLALALLGTALTVYTSVGRQARVHDTAEAQASEIEDRRTAIKKKLATAEAMLDEERRKHAKECASGKGTRCDGIKASIDTYEAAVKGHKSDLSALPAPQVVGSRAKRFAEVVAIFAEHEAETRAKLERAFTLFEPFAFSLLFELGALIGFGYAFGHRRTVQVAPAGQSSSAAGQSEPPQTPGPSSPRRTVQKRALRTVGRSSTTAAGRSNVIPLDRTKALMDLKARLARGEAVPSQEALAEAWGRAKTTVSFWLGQWETGGHIPARQQEGRCKTLTGGKVFALRA